MGSYRSPRGVCSLLKWHGPGASKLPALLLSRLWFNSRISSGQVDGPGAIPGGRSNSLHAAHQQCSRVSKTQFAWGSTRAACQILGSWQTSNALALQARLCGSITPPTPPFHCGKLDQSTERSLINFDRWVQLPLPLPISWEAIRLLDCKSSVRKQNWK